MLPTSIVKRDGTVAPFVRERISSAIAKAQQAMGAQDADLCEELTDAVLEHLRVHGSEQIDVEDVQDAVILVLQGSVNYELAQAYIRYRDTRERERRLRRARNQEERSRPNLVVLTSDGSRSPWNRTRLERFLCRDQVLSQKAASDVACRVEEMLALTNVSEISVPLLMSLVDAALIQVGHHVLAESRSPLRISRELVRSHLQGSGHALIERLGHAVLEQWSQAAGFSRDVLRLVAAGRLWFDGMDDPLRGSQYQATMEGRSEPWMLLADCWATVCELHHQFQRIELVLPPAVLGHLERGDEQLARQLDRMASIARLYLYCDGRTPLLESWPLAHKNIGIATYADDFLLQGRLQELGLPMMAGPHLMQAGWKRRVAVRLAVNAQGLEGDHSRMDLLAMALVSAAKTRQQHLSGNPLCAGGELRYTVFGLPPASPGLEYLERAVVQEGLRVGLALSRATSLPARACEHFGRAFRREQH